MKIEADDVARYLRDNPAFFEQNITLLTEIDLPHLSADKTISITEYQVAALREKNQTLEAKLRELILFGEENDILGERVHQFCLAMMRAGNLASAIEIVHRNLRDEFSVPHVALRLWRGSGDGAEFSPVSQELRVYAEGLTNPSCGTHALFETDTWFGEAAPHLKSFALAPLRAGDTFGLLVLASEDPQRFYQGMGTLYLKRIAELLSVALDRSLGGNA